MTDIKELLGDVAEQAKVYDVSKPVVQVARRRARTRWLAPIAAAAAVMLVVAGAWAVWPDSHDPKPDVAKPSDLVTNLDWLPPEARPPTAPPPVLPADRAVGAAALAYGSCAAGGCYAYLLMSDGRQYRLTEQRQPMAKAVSSVSLSPDGRWLGQQVGDSYVLRDLTGVRTHQVAGAGKAAGWSPDSRWLALLNYGTGQPPYPLTMVDLRTFRTVETTGETPAAVLDTGEFLYVEGGLPGPGDETKLRLHAKNPVTGRSRLALDIDLADHLRHDERVRAIGPQSVVQDDSAVLVRVTRYVENGRGERRGHADDVLRVTWRGTVTRYELPDPTPGEAAGSEPPDELWAKSGESWGIVGQYGKDLLLRHQNNANFDLQALDTRTRELRTVCRLPVGIKDMFTQRGW